MSPEIVTYEVDDETVASFEIEPSSEDFEPAGFKEVAGRVADATEPVVRAARVILDRVKALSPDAVEVKFGIKVTGGADWIFARATADANFEVRLSWKRREGDDSGGDSDGG